MEPVTGFGMLCSLAGYLIPAVTAFLSGLLPGRQIRRSERRVLRAFRLLTCEQMVPITHPSVDYVRALLQLLGERARCEERRARRKLAVVRTLTVILGLLFLIISVQLDLREALQALLAGIREYRAFIRELLPDLAQLLR